MVYQNNIPQGNQRPSKSQGDLLGNFEDLKTYLDRNHVDIDDPGTNIDEGKHKFVQMPEQTAAPTTAINEGALFTLLSNGLSELFWRPEGDDTEIQMTSGNIENETVKIALSGGTFLPGGLILKWGRVTWTAGSPGVLVKYSDNDVADFPNQGFVVVVTAISGNSITNVTGISKSGFTIARSSFATQQDVTYIALGN